MKRLKPLLLAILPFIFISSSLHAQRGLLPGAAALAARQSIKKMGFLTLAPRCNSFTHSARDRKQCHNALKKMFRALDIRITVKGEFGFAAFGKELIELLKQPKTRSYLSDLKQILSDSENPHSYNLWHWTLDYFNHNKLEALRHIAILFQDSSDYVHVAYVKGSGFSEEEANSLQLVNKLLSEKLKFNLYPEHLIQTKVRSQYHYYVIRYLSYKTCQRDNSKYCNLVPFLLDSTYHFFTKSMLSFASLNLDEEQLRLFTEKWTTKSLASLLNFTSILKRSYQVLVLTPPPFNPDQRTYEIESLYLGYLGSLDGHVNQNEILSFDEFKVFMGQDSQAFFQDMF